MNMASSTWLCILVFISDNLQLVSGKWTKFVGSVCWQKLEVCADKVEHILLMNRPR